MLPWFPYCYTLLYVCLCDFPSESSHGARCYASHCVRSNNICHKCSLRCNRHSQPGLLIYSFVSYEPTLTGLRPAALTHAGLPLRPAGSRVSEGCRGALIAWGFKDTSCWPTHSFYDEQQNAFMPFINAPKLSQLHF